MLNWNKKAQAIDTEVFTNPAFVILAIGAIGATLLGYIGGSSFGLEQMPIWQLLIVMVIEIIFAYFIVWKMSN